MRYSCSWPHNSTWEPTVIFDFRKIDQKEIIADLCIIGAGAAGITLAREFDELGVRVCLLESGGLQYEPEIQALNEGVDIGFQEGSTVGSSGLRYFGGSTNHWVGHCAPYNPMDFESRPWVPHSGWPIAKEDLDPYYQTAQSLFDLGPNQYELTKIPEMKSGIPAFDPTKISAKVWQMSSTRFGIKFRKDLEQAKNISVYLYAHVTELVTNKENSKVGSVKIRTLDGKNGNVRARYFVLACGGIENARMLLLSNGASPNGIGNQHDLVGRFYMDHLRVHYAATAHVVDDHLFDGVIDYFSAGGVQYKPLLCPTDRTQRDAETLNWCVQIAKIPPMQNEGLDAADEIYNDLLEGEWPDEFSRKAWAVVSDLSSVARGLYRRYKPRSLHFLARCENAPNYDSRITLTTERDAHGQNKAQRNWLVTTREKDTIRSAMRLMGEEIGRLSLGRVKLANWLLEDDNFWPDYLYGGGIHHVGTTRMASDPKNGVVDKNCRVHTTENLFIAGSSVFATSGYTHPTLTVGAVSLRLADHLKFILKL